MRRHEERFRIPAPRPAEAPPRLRLPEYVERPASESLRPPAALRALAISYTLAEVYCDLARGVWAGDWDRRTGYRNPAAAVAAIVPVFRVRRSAAVIMHGLSVPIPDWTWPRWAPTDKELHAYVRGALLTSRGKTTRNRPDRPHALVVTLLAVGAGVSRGRMENLLAPAYQDLQKTPPETKPTDPVFRQFERFFLFRGLR